VIIQIYDYMRYG